MDDRSRAVLLDIDGTLVDTAYHHAIAWQRAFSEHGVEAPTWLLHRRVGMGGDRLVSAVAGDDVERRLGDAIRDAWESRFEELLPEIRPLPGARELPAQLEDAGFGVVLATSAIGRHVDAFLEILGAGRLRDATVSKDDVDASKPAPDLVVVALERAGTREAVLVGDTAWDAHAATDAGIPFLGVLTGGYGVSELRDAGAAEVFEGLDEICLAAERALDRADAPART
jgi:phosphoglycolate phosphatase-like HAD superfamily hydrolase